MFDKPITRPQMKRSVLMIVEVTYKNPDCNLDPSEHMDFIVDGTFNNPTEFVNDSEFTNENFTIETKIIQEVPNVSTDKICKTPFPSSFSLNIIRNVFGAALYILENLLNKIKRDQANQFFPRYFDFGYLHTYLLTSFELVYSDLIKTLGDKQ